MMKTILIIEDIPEISDNTVEILEMAGYNTLTASNGSDGYDIIQNSIPDLILCDIWMPVLNGYELLTATKRIDSTKNIPFVFVTARTEQKEIQRAIDLGVSAYLKKPFDIEELLKVVGSCLQEK